MRIIAALSKIGRASYLSHLDIQRTLQRAMRRADLPLRYSNGFNPHPEVHFATALSTGDESTCEWFDVLLDVETDPVDFIEKLNASLPEGLSVSQAFESMENGFGSLTARLVAAKYHLVLHTDGNADIFSALRQLLNEKEIIIDKRTKGGVKPHDLRPQILDAVILDSKENTYTLEVTGTLTAAGGLRMESFVKVLLDRLNQEGSFHCCRKCMYFDGSIPLPILKQSEEKE